MNDIVLGGGIAGGKAGEVGVFMYNGKVGTIRDGGRVVKLEIPPLEKKQGDQSLVSLSTRRE